MYSKNASIAGGGGPIFVGPERGLFASVITRSCDANVINYRNCTNSRLANSDGTAYGFVATRFLDDNFVSMVGGIRYTVTERSAEHGYTILLASAVNN